MHTNILGIILEIPSQAQPPPPTSAEENKATSEGGQLPTTKGEYTAYWYDNPRTKRKRAEAKVKSKGKKTPTRRSKRIRGTENSPTSRTNKLETEQIVETSM